MAYRFDLTEEELAKFIELANREKTATTLSERDDLHGECFKVLFDVILNTFDAEKDYSPDNKRSKQ